MTRDDAGVRLWYLGNMLSGSDEGISNDRTGMGAWKIFK